MITTRRVSGVVLGYLLRCPLEYGNSAIPVRRHVSTVYLKFAQRISSRHKPFCVLVRGIGSSSSTVDKDCLTGVLKDYPEQKIAIYTCEDVYKKWRKERKFFSIPKSGVHVDITFVDTMVNTRGENTKKITPSSPTVLCIHGIPGNYNVFSHLITDFGNQGVRAIVPNFPDVLYLKGKHKEELFRHSVEEKTQVFKDFLAALNVTRLDGIIAHSSAIYPAIRLALEPELDVKCQIWFNTGSHQKTHTMKPYPVVWVCSHLFLHPLGRKFIMQTGKLILKYILRSELKYNTIDLHGLMLLAITMVFSEYWKIKQLFFETMKQELPTLLIFSEDDRVVHRSLTYEVLDLLGVTKENITFFDEEAKLRTPGIDKPWLRIVSFEKGSHYVFRKHPEICNREVFNIMRKTIPGICEKPATLDTQRTSNEHMYQNSTNMHESYSDQKTRGSGRA